MARFAWWVPGTPNRSQQLAKRIQDDKPIAVEQANEQVAFPVHSHAVRSVTFGAIARENCREIHERPPIPQSAVRRYRERHEALILAGGEIQRLAVAGNDEAVGIPDTVGDVEHHAVTAAVEHSPQLPHPPSRTC